MSCPLFFFRAVLGGVDAEAGACKAQHVSRFFVPFRELWSGLEMGTRIHPRLDVHGNFRPTQKMFRHQEHIALTVLSRGMMFYFNTLKAGDGGETKAKQGTQLNRFHM